MPCRNEEKFIGKCLDSIIANDYPKDKLEILVSDGMSTDRTREIVRSFSEKYPFISLIENPKKIVPTALNLAIKNTKGEIIIRMDAHNIYGKDYISLCVKHMQENDVDNVGGIWITLPGKNTNIANAIAIGISHPFGVGNAYYRIDSKEPRFVDTVPFGCYKRDIFDRIGFFDEELIRNQDDEFNLRIIKSGGKILLVPDIVSHYYARDSLSKLWKMFFQYGHYKPLVARKIGSILTIRQLMPAIFVGSLISSGILSLLMNQFLWLFFSIVTVYLLANLTFSFSIALKKGMKYFFTLPLIFSTIHFSYGTGYFKGFVDFFLFKKQTKKKIEDIPLTR